MVMHTIKKNTTLLEEKNNNPTGKSIGNQQTPGDKRHICPHCLYLRPDGYCPVWRQYPDMFAPIFKCPYFKAGRR